MFDPTQSKSTEAQTTHIVTFFANLSTFGSDVPLTPYIQGRPFQIHADRECEDYCRLHWR